MLTLPSWLRGKVTQSSLMAAAACNVNIRVSLDLKCSKLIENTGSMPILIPPTPVMSRLTVYGQFNKDIGELTEFLLEYVPKGGDPKI